jgi:hypothetical protein
MHETHAVSTERFCRVELTPGGSALELELENGSAIGRCECLDDAPALRIFGRALLIARVKAQDFAIAIARRKLELKDSRTVEAAIGARRHSRQGQKLAMKDGFARESGGMTHVDDALMCLEQQIASRAYALASEPGSGSRVTVLAHEVFELAEAHTTRARQITRVTETLGRRAHARAEPFEESNVTVLAAVEEIRSATLARSKPGGPRLDFGREEPNVLGSRRAGGAGG